MEQYKYNEQYMLKDDRPWFPVMGEMHYSRYPKKYWRESLYKLKAGGVGIVSTHTIWIHHEEIEGDYDFTGDRDLNTFIKECQACGLKLILRIGPWSHAGVRNGGFPDWLLKKGFEARTNHEKYLEYVRIFYSKIYEQAEGMLLRDGGPVLGVQIENEYGRCGGLTGEIGEEHMRRLTKIAKEVGFDVPFYTATGWGGSVTGGLLPVMGCCCEAPWDKSITEFEPNENYMFTLDRNDSYISSDYGLGIGLTFNSDHFPYLTAELGGGLQTTQHRRPVVRAKDVGAMSLVKLGSGVNMLGYYMFHGGTNPVGKLTTLQESRDSGSNNDLPVLSYDFMAPIREFGQISDTFKEVKLITMFLNDFGSQLCEMPAIIPEDNPQSPQDIADVRYAFRHNGNSGYVFVNNYQRRYTLMNHKHVKITVPLKEEEIEYPIMEIDDGEYYFYPFNMDIGGATLKTALATPLCKLNNKVGTYIFYTDREDPHYIMDGTPVDSEIVTISRADALNAWKIIRDIEYLVISDSTIVDEEDRLIIIGRERARLKVYPEFTHIPFGFEMVSRENKFAIYECARANKKAEIMYKLISEDAEKKTYALELYIPARVDDCFLKINYAGDEAKLYMDGKYIADQYYTGETFEVGLKRFDFPNKLTLEIYKLKEKAYRFIEEWPEMINEEACEVLQVTLEVENQDSI